MNKKLLEECSSMQSSSPVTEGREKKTVQILYQFHPIEYISSANFYWYIFVLWQLMFTSLILWIVFSLYTIVPNYTSIRIVNRVDSLNLKMNVFVRSLQIYWCFSFLLYSMLLLLHNFHSLRWVDFLFL